MSVLTIIYSILCSLSIAVGQVMFKCAAQYNGKLQGSVAAKVLQNYVLMGALAWYAASSLFYFYILTLAPLSKVYPFVLFGSGIVPLLAWLLFGETIGVKYLAGYLLMLAGLGLIVTNR